MSLFLVAISTLKIFIAFRAISRYFTLSSVVQAWATIKLQVSPPVTFITFILTVSRFLQAVPPSRLSFLFFFGVHSFAFGDILESLPWGVI